MDDAAEFIESSTSVNEQRIRFDWNGKHGEEYVDRNLEFREAGREAVLANVSTAPLELVRDLFRAETQCSREAWGIVQGVSVLAETLLRRAGPDYLDDYLEGKSRSFDASLGSAFEYEMPLVQAMLGAVPERLRSSPDYR